MASNHSFSFEIDPTKERGEYIISRLRSISANMGGVFGVYDCRKFRQVLFDLDMIMKSLDTMHYEIAIKNGTLKEDIADDKEIINLDCRARFVRVLDEPKLYTSLSTYVQECVLREKGWDISDITPSSKKMAEFGRLTELTLMRKHPLRSGYETYCTMMDQDSRPEIPRQDLVIRTNWVGVHINQGHGYYLYRREFPDPAGYVEPFYEPEAGETGRALF